MMNDHVSAQLRRYLVETANEMPGDGQLEAVVRRTSTARQLRPWVARLRTPPVLGSTLGQQMRLVMVAALIAGLTAGVTWIVGSQLNHSVINQPTQATPEPTPSTVFEGTWTSSDTADESTQTLVVAPGRSPDVHFEDDFSISCERRGEPSTVYLADGVGEIDRGRLTVTFPTGGCGIELGSAVWFYDYDAATDSLIDYQDIVWHRVP